MRSLLGEEDQVEDEETNIKGLMGDVKEEEVSNKKYERAGRFVLYWTTIYAYSYGTTYSTTSTLATVMCTPSGFSLYSACGKKKK